MRVSLSIALGAADRPLFLAGRSISGGRRGKDRGRADTADRLAPLLGVILVLNGRSLPTLLIDALTLLGQSASGVALFAAGIILAVHHVRMTGRAAALAFIKNIVEPGLVWVSLYALGYRNPLLGEAVVTTALPILVTVAMLAVRYQVAERSCFTLFIGMGSSLLTVAGFIA